jgi:uncharacterized protein YaaN involved in tellurite resistance
MTTRLTHAVDHDIPSPNKVTRMPQPTPAKTKTAAKTGLSPKAKMKNDSSTPKTVTVAELDDHNFCTEKVNAPARNAENLPAIRVQESQLPAPLTMREASQMGSSVIQANSQIARQITATAQASDLDELGKGLVGLMVASKEYDPSRWAKFSLVRMFKKKAAAIEGHVRTVDQNVEAVVRECDRQVRLMDQRIVNLEALYEENEALYSKLGEAIADAEARIAESEANPPEYIEGDARSAQQRSQWNTANVFARKRVEDLKAARALSMLQAPQLQASAENCYNVIQTFGTLKETTIPTMQRVYAAYVVQSETKKAVSFAGAVRDQTNKAMIANAKTLHSNTVESNKALGQSLVSIETLQLVHQELMDSISDVSRIRTEMVTRMKADAPRLEQMNQQISKSLLLTQQ